MRPLLCLLVPAAIAAAADTPLIAARGDDLASFAVDLHLERVDRSTPLLLAASFFRFEDEQRAVARRFRDLFRRAHLAVLERYYAADLLAQQRKAYAARGKDGRAGWEVDSIRMEPGDEAASVLAHRKPDASKKVKLSMARGVRGWRIVEIFDQVKGGEPVKRALGIPPEVRPVAVPAMARPDRSAPLALVKSLRRDMVRLRVRRTKAAQALQARFFDILAAFYGADAARIARTHRPPLRSRKPLVFELVGPVRRAGKVMRVEVLVLEEVPGAKGKRSALGEAAFDLLEGPDGWRISAESARPKPSAPMRLRKNGFALVFLAG